MMKNLYHLRNTKKSWLVYALGLFIFCSVALGLKNFNDKMTMMGDSVHRYQAMIDKQSEQLSDVTREKERYKRDLEHVKEVHSGTMKEMETRFTTLQDDCKQETRRLEGELGELQDTHNRVTEEKHKLESKYRTLSKANSAAIADAENLKQDNKKLRTQLHEATTSKTSELIDLKDKLEKMTQERDQFEDQYTALFKQHQQYSDNIGVLQQDRDRLQDQIREIQRLSHGDSKSSSAAPAAEQVGVEPGAAQPKVSSSTVRAVSPGQQVVEEPGPAPAPSSSPASAARAAAAPPLAEPREDRRVEAAAALARYPPLRPRAEQLRDLRPLQPQPRLEPEDAEGEEEDEEDVDVLNAPIARHYGQQQEYQYAPQQQQYFYPGAQVQQMVPQVGKYGGAAAQVGGQQIMRHGDHYHVQQPQQQRGRQQQQQQQYWGGYNNDLQDLYRQQGRQRDF